MIYKILLLNLVLVSSAWGYDLFELHKKRYTHTDKLVPNRLYAVNEPSLNRRVLKLTDASGKFSEQGEGLMPLSVLDGEWIGGDPGKRYLLQSNGLWVETSLPEDHYFWRVGAFTEYYHRKVSSK